MSSKLYFSTDGASFDAAKIEEVLPRDGVGRGLGLKIGGATGSQMKFLARNVTGLIATKGSGGVTAAGWTLTVGNGEDSFFDFAGSSIYTWNRNMADSCAHPLANARTQAEDVETVYFKFRLPAGSATIYQGVWLAQNTRATYIGFYLESTGSLRIRVNGTPSSSIQISPAIIRGTWYYGAISYSAAGGDVSIAFWSDGYNGGSQIASGSLNRGAAAFTLHNLLVGWFPGSGGALEISDLQCENMSFQYFASDEPAASLPQIAGVSGTLDPSDAEICVLLDGVPAAENSDRLKLRCSTDGGSDWSAWMTVAEYKACDPIALSGTFDLQVKFVSDSRQQVRVLDGCAGLFAPTATIVQQFYYPTVGQVRLAVHPSILKLKVQNANG